MDNVASKRTKTRSKSIGSEKSPMEAAPNLNGSIKDGDQDVEENMELLCKTEEIDEQEDVTTHGRKRKADEMKNDFVESEIKQSDEKTKVTTSDTETSADEIKDLNTSDDQILGKGKRARIPNKRYSDLSLNASANKIPDDKIKKENGEFSSKENSSTPSTNTSSSSIIKEMKIGSPGTAKKNKAIMCAPAYLKPFSYGWKRELVYRATFDNPLKRSGDIYYYTPAGKKLRSMREVGDNLKNTDLTLENFTFFREPLGLCDPEQEIIRDAKLKTTKKTVAPKLDKPVRISSPKTSSVVVPTPSNNANTSTASSQVNSPKNKNVKRVQTFKVKLPSKAKNLRSRPARKTKESEKMDIVPPQRKEAPKKATPKYGNNLNDVDNKPCRPCSIRCQGVSGLIPTLQCRLCLCLYHYECVGLAPIANIQGYVCKNCQLDQDSLVDSSTAIIPPTSLTSISTLKSIANQSSILPQLQRMSQVGDAINSNSEINNLQLPKLIPRPNISLPKLLPKHSDIYTSHHSENKSLVGSVTTWFPPSSTIQVGNNEMNTENDNVRVPRPQFVEYIGNKKFLIVPKHNVLSVLPNSTFNRPEENVSIPDITKDSTDIMPNIPQIPDSAKMERNIVSDDNDIPPTETNISGAPHSSPASPVKEQEQQENVNEDISEKTTKSPERVSTVQKVTTPPELNKQPKLEVLSDKKTDIHKFMDNYLQNLAYGYNTLLFVFQYLKVQDLLRAGCVCTMWRDVANHPILWKTVRMKNSQIHSFDGLADTLKKQGTVHLDLRKMLLPAGGGDEIWPSFSDAIKRVESLRKIELCRCPASVVEKLVETNPNLEVINAITIKCESMSLEPFQNLTNIKELKLKSTNGLALPSDLNALVNLKQIKHLSLTSIKDLNKLDLSVIAKLGNLESLDLGECTDFPKTFGTDILIKLTKLEKLRLEKGQETCYTFEILEAVKNMEKLEQLELVNFDIKTGFNKALGACSNIKKLLIIPTYISQSATTNNMVLGGVLRLRNTLTHFVWGVTLELLRVTELFVDQCEEPDNKKDKKKPSGTGDSIPVLKPVPSIDDISNDSELISDPPQVEILPLPNLQRLLLQNLPTTRVKILKIPFHATWRQSITDTAN